MKKTLRRLTLSRETLRRLDGADLHEAAGGGPPTFTAANDCQTVTSCPTAGPTCHPSASACCSQFETC